MCKRKLLSLGLVSIMMLSLVGCGKETSEKKSKDMTADAVVGKYETVMADVESYEIDGNTSININMESKEENVTIDIPIDITYDVKTDGKENAFASFDVNIDLQESLGEDVSMSADAYVQIDETNTHVWMREDGTEDWIYSVSENADTSENNFDIDGNLSTTDTQYVITQSFDTILNSELFENALNTSDFTSQDLDTELAELGVDYDTLIDQLSQSFIVYTFDKDTFYLTNLSLNDMSMEFSIPNGDSSINLNIVIESTNDVKSYNELTAEDYTVSDEIKANAISSEEVDSSDVYDDTISDELIEEEDVIEDNTETDASDSVGDTSNIVDGASGSLDKPE